MTPFSTVYTVFLCIFLDLDGLACGTGALVPSFFGSSTGISKTWFESSYFVCIEFRWNRNKNVSIRMVVFPLVAELLPYTSVQALSWIINCGSNLDRLNKVELQHIIALPNLLFYSVRESPYTFGILWRRVIKMVENYCDASIWAACVMVMFF